MAPDTTNNTYALEIDGQTCFVIGGTIPTNSWTWVDYQNGAVNSKVQLALSQGTHSLKFVGMQPNVKLDRVVFASDLTCVPVGIGDNCNTPTDSTPPAVTLTAPADGATASGTITVSADASDASGISKVEFYINGSLQASPTAAPYALSLNTASFTNNTYTVTAKAYDTAGNFASDTNSLTIKNGDAQAPSTPTNVVAKASAYNKVALSWKASTDNIGVSGYTITRNGTPLTQVGATTSYQDNTVTAGTKYTYQVTAFDAAGNTSAGTSAAVTIPNVPDAVAPSVPTSLQASVASSSQINLSWISSSDNIGVSGYDVYRATATGTATKVATVTTTSFGDTNLSPTTKYSYYVRAKDAAGNTSAASTTATATTSAAPLTKTVISGIVRNNKGNPIAGARVTVQVGTKRSTFTTDSKGKYTTNTLGAGRYTVTYRLKNYRSQSLSVRVNANQVTTQNVTLQKK
jgi:chitodextrinase